MLDQAGDVQPVDQQCADDFPQAVVPFMGHRRLERDVGLDIGALVVPHLRRLTLEIRQFYRQGVFAVFIERPQHRVALADEQPSSRLEQFADGACPGVDAR
ncbi:hypothetical protein D3C80_1689400 [compost metagenome]